MIPWTLEVRLDGATVPARVDPGRDQTVWLRPGAVADAERVVRIELAGKTLRVTVRCTPADQEGVLLGRDVLSGRFLLRP